ncbi:hypothetical protein K458DRAFT_8373 [Lentithecium fluviatile CBS 122367]|uniref:Uncharacterized protein n=1 Tax=Lentithecium fluviatile CBS 122367 TaxID=1168545 RepID=A0A6G1JPB6_9PLEO|nr:hypothetical protein K458DRAFT_8373 [Lentithecium fluviatile CBS 122367]
MLDHLSAPQDNNASLKWEDSFLFIPVLVHSLQTDVLCPKKVFGSSLNAFSKVVFRLRSFEEASEQINYDRMNAGIDQNRGRLDQSEARTAVVTEKVRRRRCIRLGASQRQRKREGHRNHWSTTSSQQRSTEKGKGMMRKRSNESDTRLERDCIRTRDQTWNGRFVSFRAAHHSDFCRLLQIRHDELTSYLRVLPHPAILGVLDPLAMTFIAPFHRSGAFPLELRVFVSSHRS